MGNMGTGKLLTPTQGKKVSGVVKEYFADPKAWNKKYPHSERRARAAAKMAAIKKKKLSKVNKGHSLNKKTLLGV